ncbi:DUF2171 domain-containing protein [Sphingomonas sp. ac-8]|uniref:DUF2171 domain-containing protein n=1 Tax=Sphingomonas sp. ac-8 TaxID=3242977 RepID=UPI003A80210F
MGDDRYNRGNTTDGDYYDRGQDYGSGRDYTYSSARDYAAAGQDGDRGRGYGRGGGYAGRDSYGSREGYGGRGSGGDYAGAGRYRDRGSNQSYRGSYASDGHRFADVERDDRDRSSWDRDNRYSGEGASRYGSDRASSDYSSGRDYRGDRSYGSDYGYGDRNRNERNYGSRSYGETSYGDRSYGNRYGQDRYDRDTQRFRGRPQGYNYDERGFLERAGDEVRSWFGDEDAERRREYDQRYDEQRDQRDYGRNRDRYGNDTHYGSWRSAQLAEFDRDYDEYRQENATKFHNEFSTFRTERKGQRDSLSRVQEHMEVVGSDGKHVGKVDKVRGDRIVLTKSDSDAHGHHHSIPSRWIETVDDKVKIRKSADEAKSHWRDEERNQSMFSDDSRNTTGGSTTSGTTGTGTTTTTGTTGTTGTGSQTAGTGQSGTTFR